ncbi:MAG: hypothetical protein ACWA5R_07070, partial [bacterium]
NNSILSLIKPSLIRDSLKVWCMRAQTFLMRYQVQIYTNNGYDQAEFVISKRALNKDKRYARLVVN